MDPILTSSNFRPVAGVDVNLAQNVLDFNMDRFPDGNYLAPMLSARRTTRLTFPEFARHLLHVLPFPSAHTSGAAREGERSAAEGLDDEAGIPPSKRFSRASRSLVLIVPHAFHSFNTFAS